MSEPVAPVIVFDGVCQLCSRSIRFVLARPKAPPYRFAAVQSESGRALLAQHGLDPTDPVSFLLLDSAGAHTDSDAVLRVIASFGGAWRHARLIRIVPRRWRDACYRLIARNRYRWFGKRDRCLVPDAAVRARFLP
jgi:predicted DCC family thiol-disulfide oxidoreductase YuxK